jgi:ketosteroid isomerase-like protein
MSEENVEIVRRVYDAVARRDTDAVLAFYDREVEWDFTHGPVGAFLGRRVYRGHADLRNWWREWYEAWEDYEPELEEVVDAGEHVISVVRARARGRTSGIEIHSHPAGVWTIREGKVVRVAWFGSRHEALKAAGLRE